MLEPVQRLAPAKVNLGLHVLRRRDDGFHDVETVMFPIGWADKVAAKPQAGFDFSCSDPVLPTDERNLVVQAARLLAAHANVQLDVSIHLEKRVPYGAGLGSGSSDAAATLLLLADAFGIDIPMPDLSEIAAELGSDVPFFLQRQAAMARGRGEQISPLRTDGASYAMPFDVVVAVPPVFVSTADAYRLVTSNDDDRAELSSLVLSNDLAEWRTHLVNDFEIPVLAMEPKVAEAKQVLLDAEAGYAALSGSGAAVFGIFESPEDAQKASISLRGSGCRVWVEQAKHDK